MLELLFNFMSNIRPLSDELKEVLAQNLEIIDFAIEDDPIAAGGVRHRLASSGQIDDGQASEGDIDMPDRVSSSG